MVQEAEMDHDFIDGNLVPELFLKKALAPELREAFEAHKEHCEECQDRLLLAEMFLLEAESPSSSVPRSAGALAEELLTHASVNLDPPDFPFPGQAPGFKPQQKFVEIIPPRRTFKPVPEFDKSRPPKQLVYVPKNQGFLSSLEPWQVTWLLVAATVLLAVILATAITLYIYRH
jgi:hypothetical protein